MCSEARSNQAIILCLSYILIQQYELFHPWTILPASPEFLFYAVDFYQQTAETHHGNYFRFTYPICADVVTPSCALGIEHDMQAYTGIVGAGNAVKEILA
jgi:hypothetical protein